jgi:hypothetical protein
MQAPEANPNPSELNLGTSIPGVDAPESESADANRARYGP